MKIVAFLPVKGNSERIANKNIKILDGKPLFIRALDKLLACSFIDKVYLDTESDHIIELANEKKCLILKRDPNLASNKTDGHKLFYNEVAQVEADIYIQMLSTSPFIHPDTIKKGIDILSNSDEFDSVVLVKKDKQYTWDFETRKTNYDFQNIPNSIDLKDTIIETMGLYIVKKNAAQNLRRRIGEKPFLLEATALEAIDVNYPEDFELANFIAAGIRENERKLFRNISYQLNSALLSDILDDLKFENQIIKGLNLNLEGRKLLGRAKTLKIKEKKEQDTSSIYDALLTYQTIVPNDIILVENELPSYAYFGELNANLAIRAGAIGAIIGGNTRDNTFVKQLNFPVFSEGYNCQDIKNRGTVESFNKKIRIKGVEINHEDLVFADSEGVVIIPKEIEKIVLEKAKDVIKKENNIVSEVSEGIDVLDIRSRYGDF
jgi:CMP-N-acetylneuraminic acid synthetase/regulator of RNase E activity RraA